MQTTPPHLTDRSNNPQFSFFFRNRDSSIVPLLLLKPAVTLLNIDILVDYLSLRHRALGFLLTVGYMWTPLAATVDLFSVRAGIPSPSSRQNIGIRERESACCSCTWENSRMDHDQLNGNQRPEGAMSSAREKSQMKCK